MKPKLQQNHINIEKIAIRRYFYLGSIIAIILPTVLLISIYSNSLQQEYAIKVQQLSTSILAEKKRFLSNAIDRTIYLIESELKQARNHAAKNNLSIEQADSIAKERISQIIRDLRLVDNGYIWVNKIVNYNGGDNYAIRLIHPNLPNTEGDWLSTNTQDQQGNYPYKIELEGVKKYGDLFYQYYFKKMGTDTVSNKMSYAKLYAPFNWVIATGIYIDDLDQLIADETARMRATNRMQKERAIVITVLAVLGSLLIIVAFEKLIQKLILNYETKLDNYTQYLEKISKTDKLTSLNNRLKLDELFEHELIRAKRYGTPFSVLMIDIDWFKNVNDQFGHQVGDLVLQETAALLHSNVREADMVGRWGGEEFIIICPETSLEGAKHSGDKIRAAVASYLFSNSIKLTCSIGISIFHENDSKEDLIKRADEALYLAKNTGRDQVEIERNATL